MSNCCIIPCLTARALASFASSAAAGAEHGDAAALAAIEAFR